MKFAKFFKPAMLFAEIGALNWGLFKFLGFDLVAWIGGFIAKYFTSTPF